MDENTRHPASFRDPAGSVFTVNNRVLRGLTTEGAKRYADVKKTGLFELLEHSNSIVQSKEINHSAINTSFVQYLEHELIPFISYPYEWPFELLKAAALHHLSIQLQALDNDVVLIDASAYNIQFKNVSPVFIDVLSFRPYQQGEFWSAHRQFCEQFLNPLLLFAIKGIPYHEWYRGAMEGISTDLLANIMPFKSWFSPKSLIHVLLPARSQQKLTEKQKNSTQGKIQTSTLPKAVYKKFLEQLHNWISGLKPRKWKSTLWENYTTNRIYQSAEVSAKQQFIAEFVSTIVPKQLWDLGCNDGEFSEIALKNGAEFVVGFDVDLAALDNAVQRARVNNLNFLPLYHQITNPSPSQGWLLKERTPILERGQPDAVIALAFIHHLALGHNLPLEEVVQWIVKIAPHGVIEFVQKSDPTVQQMLRLKGDIFPNYTEEAFKSALNGCASIIKVMTVSETGRQLYWYRKT